MLKRKFNVCKNKNNLINYFNDGLGQKIQFGRIFNIKHS